MALTKKQIKQLRALAHHENPLVQIGKNDITDNVVKQAAETINKRELIKCQVMDGAGFDAAECAEKLAGQIGAQIVQVIGNRFVLYRKSTRPDVEHIRLVRD
ncbi:ribosome assembly RNA-binding protein YhbY [Bifidobacterium gallicum]|uniref:RNA-binding protein n=1 Tax=Bifidobacterium gallicum DSM 20093 = LMG 11596 TaxID=561180 RepID=D1NU25_9BIFI|nr:ribosome assembly RNA-binding protein YhbY [Bifidobacterium gallicum]EFA23229.1 RNA-binding protein, YhbY family [Bifidobacterium gallicum DSM 20093 = LMG 11596]KFI58889.1 RNA-binding protein [Bifidobacterium gallicum DSM 20093 = LMG 11596]